MVPWPVQGVHPDSQESPKRQREQIYCLLRVDTSCSSLGVAGPIMTGFEADSVFSQNSQGGGVPCMVRVECCPHDHTSGIKNVSAFVGLDARAGLHTNSYSLLIGSTRRRRNGIRAGNSRRVTLPRILVVNVVPSSV
jgi:hypothetical protein